MPQNFFYSFWPHHWAIIENFPKVGPSYFYLQLSYFFHSYECPWEICRITDEVDQYAQPDVLHISPEIIPHQNKTVQLTYFNLWVMKWCICVRSRSFEWHWTFEVPKITPTAPTQEGFIVYLSWWQQVRSDKLKVDLSISIRHRLIALLTKTLNIVTLEFYSKGWFLCTGICSTTGVRNEWGIYK